MKKVILVSFMALVTMTMMSSCVGINWNNLNSGDWDSTPTQVPEMNKKTAMEPFDKVSVANAFKVIYEQSTEHSVRIEAPEQAFKEMTVYVKDGELRIRKAVKKTSPKVSFSDVKLYVTSPAIKGIEIAGSGMFAASNKVDVANNLNVQIAGSGQVMLVDMKCIDTYMEIAGSGGIEMGNLVTQNAKAQIAGSGDINLGVMSCSKFNIEIAGSGDVNSNNITAGDVRIEIAGSGDVNCNNITADNVHTEIAGSGDVTLKGKVKNPTQEIAGSGKVHYEELKTE